MHYLTICAIFRDEARHLAEWVAFHEEVGVEHFFLFDDRSADDPERVLRPWIDRRRVTLRPWDATKADQLRAYGACLVDNRNTARWIAFIDIDEFLFPASAGALPDILAPLEHAPGVGANWVMYGSSGNQTPPAAPTTLAYQLHAPINLRISDPRLRIAGSALGGSRDYRAHSTHIKSIVDPSRVARIRTPHSFDYAGGALAITPAGVEITGTPGNAFTEVADVSTLRINHYWSRSLEEFERKLARPRIDGGGTYDARIGRFMESVMNAVHGPEAIDIGKRVAARLGLPEDTRSEADWRALATTRRT